MYRRFGSRLIGAVNRRIFHQPKDLVVSNFRIMNRDVVKRICSYKTRYPYITGLALMFSHAPANVLVEHKDRDVGKSTYGLFKIIEVVTRILFNYSSYPLRLLNMIGIAISSLSFSAGLYYIGRALLGKTKVPGWTTVVVLLSFFSGIIILSLSILGEYAIRILSQTSYQESYYVTEVVGRDV